MVMKSTPVMSEAMPGTMSRPGEGECERVDRAGALLAQLRAEGRERPARVADVVDEEPGTRRGPGRDAELPADVRDLLGGVLHLALRRPVDGALEQVEVLELERRGE